MHGVSVLEIRTDPSVARVKFDAARISLQDIVRAVRGDGRKYDARLLIQVNGKQDALTAVLAKLAGVRSPGIPDRAGVRMITFKLEERTMYADLVAAAKEAGVHLKEPELNTN